MQNIADTIGLDVCKGFRIAKVGSDYATAAVARERLEFDFFCRKFGIVIRTNTKQQLVVRVIDEPVRQRRTHMPVCAGD